MVFGYNEESSYSSYEEINNENNIESNNEIQDINIQNSDNLNEACQNLVNKANQNGGPDNITAIIIKVSL